MLSVFPTHLDFLRFEEGNDREGNWKPAVVTWSSVQMQKKEGNLSLPAHRPSFSFSVVLF